MASYDQPHIRRVMPPGPASVTPGAQNIATVIKKQLQNRAPSDAEVLKEASKKRQIENARLIAAVLRYQKEYGVPYDVAWNAVGNSKEFADTL